MTNKVQIKLKPWGKEIWFAQNNHYAGKILKIIQGERISLQYHEEKVETLYIFQGEVKLTYGTDKSNLQEKILNKGDKIDIHPYTIHRLEAMEDTKIFEVSTPELHDIVKISDDYGRTGKGLNEELDETLHKSRN